MQRIQKTVRAGLVLGLLLSLTAAAEAQVFYVQSSNFQAVPVSRSVVVSRSIGASRSIGVPRYFNSYGSSSSYGLGNSYGYAQAWNNRRSAPPVYVENHYLPESNDDDYTPTISSQSIGVSQPIVSSRVVSSRPVVVSQPQVIYYEPVVYSEPVRVYRSVVSSPRVTREEIKSRPNHFEYEQKGKVEAFDGRRVKTYRYEYEVDQRPGRTKVTIDFDD